MDVGGRGVSVSVGSGVDVEGISRVTEAILAVGEFVYVLTCTAVNGWCNFGWLCICRSRRRNRCLCSTGTGTQHKYHKDGY